MRPYDDDDDHFWETDRILALQGAGANSLSLSTFPFASTNVLSERSTQEVAGLSLIMNSPFADAEGLA